MASLMVVIMIGCGDGSDSSSHHANRCNPNNGECERLYFKGTPFTGLDDLVSQIETFKTAQLTMVNDDISAESFFNGQISTTQKLASQTAATASSTSMLLSFLNLYLDESDYSLICLYKFQQKENIADPDNYIIREGLLLAKYNYIPDQKTWIYSGKSSVYIYDYISEMVQGHRIITTTFNGEGTGINSTVEAAASATPTLTLAGISTYLTTKCRKEFIDFLQKRGLGDIIVQYDQLPHQDRSSEPKSACTTWNDVPHRNLRIYLRPRGDGSLGDSLNRAKDLWSDEMIKKSPLFDKGEPGVLIANWHVGPVRKADGSICFFASESRWKKLKGQITISDTDLAEYSNRGSQTVCKEVCMPAKDFIRKIPWLLPYGDKYKIPDEVLDRIAKEIERKAPEIPEIPPDWYVTVSEFTDTIRQALNDLGQIYHSSSRISSTLYGQPINDAELLAGQDSIVTPTALIYPSPMLMTQFPVMELGIPMEFPIPFLP